MGSKASKLSPLPPTNGPTAIGPSPPLSFNEPFPSPLDVLILFGSNMGSSEELARRLAEVLGARGCRVKGIKTLDEIAQRVEEEEQQVKKEEDVQKSNDQLPTTSSSSSSNTLPRGSSSCVIIITPSYNGFPPDNALKFASLLEKERQRSPPLFSDISYAVLGQGDTDWFPTYQRFPTLVDEGMIGLGASRLLERGEINVNGGTKAIEDAFDAWTQKLVERLRRLASDGLKEGATDKAAAVQIIKKEKNKNQRKTGVGNDGEGRYSPTLAIEICPSGGEETEDEIDKAKNFHQPLPHSSSSVALTILSNRNIQSSDSERQTRHIQFALAPSLTYQPGDHLAIYPENDPALVQLLCQRLGVSKTDACIISRLGEQSETEANDSSLAPYMSLLGKKITVDHLLTRCVELSSAVTKRQLVALISRAFEKTEKEALQLLHDNPERFEAEISSQCLSAAHLLLLFPSIEASLTLILDLLPPMKSRFYSISSAPDSNLQQCSITAAVHTKILPLSAVQGRGVYRSEELVHSPAVTSPFSHAAIAPMPVPPPPSLLESVGSTSLLSTLNGILTERKEFHGLCSHFLSRCQPNQEVRGYVRDTGASFRAPDCGTPLIMIGPGTGISPMRGFLQYRDSERNRLQNLSASPGSATSSASDANLAPTVLYFGCRREDHDFLYKEELEAYQANGTLSLLRVAFSRSPSLPKTYVQDLLKEDGAYLWELIEKKAAHILVCGDAGQMAPAVTKTFVEIARKHGGMEAAAAEVFIRDLKLVSRRYKEDIWTSGPNNGQV